MNNLGGKVTGLLLALLFCLGGFTGCTNVSPSSGPVGSTVCVSSGPGDPYCGRWVELYVGGEHRHTFTFENEEAPHCFILPDKFEPGEEITVIVSGIGFVPVWNECGVWVPPYVGSFLVTE